MNNTKKFLRKFTYELVGLMIFTVIAVLLLFINKLTGFIALTGSLVYAIILLIVFNVGKKSLFFDRDGNGLTAMISGLMEKPVFLCLIFYEKCGGAIGASPFPFFRFLRRLLQADRVLPDRWWEGLCG